MVDVRPLLFVNMLLLMLVVTGAISHFNSPSVPVSEANGAIAEQAPSASNPVEPPQPSVSTPAEDSNIFADTPVTPEPENARDEEPKPIPAEPLISESPNENNNETVVAQPITHSPEAKQPAPKPAEPVVAKVEPKPAPKPQPVVQPLPKPKPVLTTGKLIIRSNVHDDMVLVNGKPFGPTKLAVDLTPGTYAVEVAKKGYVSWKSDITVKLGTSQDIRATLDEIRMVEFSNGTWLNDIKTGEGIYNDSNTEYRGSFVNGLFHGKGNAIYRDGTQFHGEWFEGQMHGEGNLITSQGDSYTGQFKENTFNGEGTLSKKNGDIYTGYWVNGQLNGQGSLTTQEGLLYVGGFSNNQFHGQGSLTYPDSRHYEGSFSKGMYHGKGTESFADGKKYNGQYMEGQYHGEGELFYPSGSKIKATFKFGQPYGKAILTTPEGEVFEARTTEPGVCYREKSYRATQCPSMEGWQ